MTKKQGSKITMFTLVALIFAKYLEKLSTLVPLVGQITLFNAKIVRIKEIVVLQGYAAKGITSAKDVLKQLLCDSLLPLCMLALGWAKIEKKEELIALFNITEDDLIHHEDKILPLAKALIKALNDNATVLVTYNITQAKITVAEEAYTKFEAFQGVPDEKKIESKVATGSLKTEIAETTAILDVCDNLIVGGFGWTDKVMVEEYTNSRKLPATIGRHTTVKANVYGDEEHSEPILGATIGIDVLNRSEITNDHGEAEIVQFKGGEYLLWINAKGFVRNEVRFSVKNGKHVELDVVLVANKIYGVLTKDGKPFANANVSIVGTNISTVTDAQGRFSLERVPEGEGVLEASTEGGDFVSKTFKMVSGQDMRIDLSIS